jgi:beta-lactamase regulating signal transducer with metallopeptidase domain
MNDFAMTVIGAALQGLLVALAAVGLYAVAARRRRGAGALVATAYLGLSALLTVLAFCPLPAWWTWERPGSRWSDPISLLPGGEGQGGGESSTAPPTSTLRPKGGESDAGSAASRDSNGPGWPLAALRAALRRFGHATAAAPEQRPIRWLSLVGAGFLVGSGLCLLRLLIGVWAVQVLRRHSRSIDDVRLEALLENLRTELDCRRWVELRESLHVGTPATVGCWHPVVLLPRTWRYWSEAERRAVLAHEIAHVCRGDYAAGLLARISIALQFYQPLVYWLAGRLQLQQELAADALAARVSGGHGPYLRALAQLALRQEGRLPGCPARAFLSAPGTLMRRIRMLQTKDCLGERTPRRGVQALLVAVLALVAVGVSALRSPAQKTGEEAPATSVAQGPIATDTGRPNVEEPPAFDLTYLATDLPGVIALRPAAVFGRPEMKPVLPLLNREVNKCFHMMLQTTADFDLPLEEIEQALFPCAIKTWPNNAPGQQSGLLCSLGMIRMVHDFDWKKRIQLLGELTEVSYSGKVYYRFHPVGTMLDFMRLGNDACFYIPDSRTLVFDHEPLVRRLLDGKPPRRNWADDWDRAAHGLLAFAYDSRDKTWFHDRKQPEEEVEVALLRTFAEQASSIVFGADCRQRITFQFMARCDTVQGSAKATQALKDFLGLQAKVALKVQERTKEGTEREIYSMGEDVYERLLQDGLQQAQVDQRGAAVFVRSEIETDFGELLKAIIAQLPPRFGKE